MTGAGKPPPSEARVALGTRTRSTTAPQSGSTHRSWIQHSAAAVVYLVLSLILFGRGAMGDPDAVCACIGDGDPTSFMWSLVWWPHAILKGLNPFFPRVVWAPDGANLTQGGFAMPAAGLVLAPVTLTAGPVVAYNVASLLLPVLAAWFTYRLCRYLTGAFGPSLLGGYVFGFGTYMVAHLLGHLNLVSVFLVPAAVHLVLLRVDEAISLRRFVALMAVVFAVQLLLSPEVLLTGLGFGGLALLLGCAACSRERRRQILKVMPVTLAAGGIAMVVTSPYLYWVLDGLGDSNADYWGPFTAAFPADALNVVVPTEVTGLGHWWFEEMTSEFTNRTPSESAAYVSAVLLAIVLGFAVTRWRSPTTRVLIGVIVVSYVLSLGTKLHVAGKSTEIPLPWALFNRLPVLDHVISARLFLYGLLAIAIAVALWLATGSTRRGLKWAVAGVGVALLVPNLSADFWRGRLTNPAFFTSGAYEEYLRDGETVLALPYSQTGSSMLWQAETRMHFRMAGGYLGPEYPPEYRSDPFLMTLVTGQVGPPDVRGLRDFLSRREVTAVVVQVDRAGPWPFLLGALGLRPVERGGVLIYRVRSGWTARKPPPRRNSERAGATNRSRCPPLAA